MEAKKENDSSKPAICVADHSKTTSGRSRGTKRRCDRSSSGSRGRSQRRADNARSRVRKAARRRARYIAGKDGQATTSSVSPSGAERRRSRSSSGSPQRPRKRTRRANNAINRARKAERRARFITNKDAQARAERDREKAEDQYRSDVALMRRVIGYDLYTAIRDPRVSVLAASIGGAMEDDFRTMKTRIETIQWAAILDPVTKSAIHRLRGMESGDNF